MEGVVRAEGSRGREGSVYSMLSIDDFQINDSL